jgi:hypothetical protein
MPGLEVTPRDEQTIEILRCFPWGGADLTSNPTGIDPTKGGGASNVVPNRRFGMFAPIKGRQLIAGGTGTNTLQSLALFPYVQQATQSTTELLASSSVGSGTYANNLVLSSCNTGGIGVWGTLNLPTYGGSPGQQPLGNVGGSWALAQQWAFFCSRSDILGYALKVDNNNNVTFSQIAPPVMLGPIVASAYAPNCRLNGAGAITTTNAFYTFTYSNATQESGAAFGANPLGPQAWGSVSATANTGLNPTNNQITMDIPVSPDSQVTTINIYRIDDLLGQFLFVGSVPNTSGYGGSAAGYARFTDNTPSSSVTGQTLIERRDTPAPFYDMTYYMGRMWGFGHDAYTPYWAILNPVVTLTGLAQPAGSSDLWYSNYNEPWGWNSVTQVVQVNPNVYGDVGVAVRGVGGVLVAWKTRSTWLIYGDSPDNLQSPIELGSQLGLVSKQSLISAFGIARWLSNQGVMQFDGANLTNISADIKEFLDGLVQTDLQAACASFHDGMYVLSFPTQSITWIYDTKTQTWFSSTFVATLYATQLEDPSLRIGVGGVEETGLGALDAVYGVANGVTIGGFPVVAAHFAFEGVDDVSTTTPIVSTWMSRVWKPTIPSYWQFESIAIEAATNLAPGSQITVNIITNPGSVGQTTTPITYTMSGLNNPMQVIELPVACQGQTVQIEVVVTGTQGQFYAIEDVKLYGHMIRKMDQGDNN